MLTDVRSLVSFLTERVPPPLADRLRVLLALPDRRTSGAGRLLHRLLEDELFEFGSLLASAARAEDDGVSLGLAREAGRMSVVPPRGTRCPCCGSSIFGVLSIDARSTPLEPSPHALIQEELRDDPWRLLVACVLLNRTHGRSVRPVLDAVFARWPSCAAMAVAAPSEVVPLLSGLGLQNRRAATLVELSIDWRDLVVDHGPRPPWSLVSRLKGIGTYGLDSYRIFVDPAEPVEPRSADRRLAAYVAWARGRA